MAAGITIPITESTTLEKGINTLAMQLGQFMAMFRDKSFKDEQHEIEKKAALRGTFAESIVISTTLKRKEVLLTSIRNMLAGAFGVNEKLGQNQSNIQEQQLGVLSGLLGAETAKQAKEERNKTNEKRQNRITKATEKAVVKGKWYERSLGFLRGAAQAAVPWFVKLLKFLAFMAFFDPSGSFMKALIGIVTNIVVMIIRVAPTIIKGIIRLIPVFAKAMFQAIVAIMGALNTVFKDLAKYFAEKSPFISQMFNFLAWLTKKGGVLEWIFRKIADNFALIMSIGAGLYVFQKLQGLAEKFSGIGKAMQKLGTFMAANPVVLIIAAIIAALAAIWIYKDKIVKFFDSLFGKFKKMGETGKTLVIVLGTIFAPLTALIGLVYGLAKAFQILSKYGLKKGGEIIWGHIKVFFESLPKMLAEGVDMLTKWLSGGGLDRFFNNVMKWLDKGITWLMGSIGSLFEGKGKSKLWEIAKKALTTIGKLLLHVVFNLGIIFYSVVEKIPLILIGVVTRGIEFLQKYIKRVPILGPVLVGILNVIKVGFHGFMMVLSKVWSVLKTLFIGIRDLINGDISFGEFAGKLLKSIWNLLKTVFFSIVNLLWVILKPIGKMLLAGLYYLLVWPFIQLWHGLVWVATKIWEGVTWIGSMLWKAFKWYLWIIAWPYKMILDLLKLAWKQLKKIGGKLWSIISNLINLFPTVVETVKSLFTWDKLKKTFTGIIDNIITNVKNLYSGAASGIKRTLWSLFRGIKIIWNRINDWLGGAWTYLKGTLKLGTKLTFAQAAAQTGVERMLDTDIDVGRLRKVAAGEERGTETQKELVKAIQNLGGGLSDKQFGTGIAKLAELLEKGNAGQQLNTSSAKIYKRLKSAKGR